MTIKKLDGAAQFRIEERWPQWLCAFWFDSKVKHLAKMVQNNLT